MLQTQFEAWLSMRQGGPEGLGMAVEARRRYTIECLHNATLGIEDEKLRQMWQSVTSTEAHALLSKPDVTVTNAKDKEVQLEKVDALDGEVGAAWGQSAAKKLRTAGKAEDVAVGFTDATLLEAGFSEGELSVRALKLVGDPDASVRKVACERLAGLGDEARAQLVVDGKIVAAVVAVETLRCVLEMEESYGNVRKAAVAALGKLDAGALAAHALAVVAKLEDSDGIVRAAAVATLGKLDAGALAAHAPAVVAKQRGHFEELRYVSNLQ